MPLTTNGAHRILSALSGAPTGSPITHMSIHSGDPGNTGLNQIGARQAVTFGSPTVSGSIYTITTSGSTVFAVPANTTVSWLGFWTQAAGGTFLSYIDVVDEIFTNGGTCTITNAKLRISLPTLQSFIDNTEKIGIGIWDEDPNRTALNQVETFGFGWYYTWSTVPLWDNGVPPDNSANQFVPMIWDHTKVTTTARNSAVASGSGVLLGFNEPDNTGHPVQGSSTPAEAIALWPQLEATGMRMGSPAPMPQNTLGVNSWLGQFMSLANQQGRRVDFIAVHYYTTNPSTEVMQQWLTDVYNQYGKPIWITEWGLVDFSNPGFFTIEQTAAFAAAAIPMLDDLSFVERHAWFSAYSGDWDINTELFYLPGYAVTPVGEVFADMLGANV